MTDLSLPNNFTQVITQATTPQEAKELTAVAHAAQEYYRERGEYEKSIEATYCYIMARRKATELLKPFIKHGGNKQDNQYVNLLDFGFTGTEWSRRKAELDIPEESVNAYFDECKSTGWFPSPYGLANYVKTAGERVVHQDWCDTRKSCNCGAK